MFSYATPAEQPLTRCWLFAGLSTDELDIGMDPLEGFDSGSQYARVRAIMPGGHDITEDGLHREIYRDGEKLRSEEVAPPIPANDGFDAAEEDLRENVGGLIKRFEKWHGVKDRSGL